MQQYELLYILPATMTDEEAKKEAVKITDLLKQNGADISQEINLEKKKLAYPIKNQRYGFYQLVEFTSETSAIAQLNSTLRLSQNVLRHMIVEKPVKSQETLEREQALRDRLAARRQQRTTTTTSAVTAQKIVKEESISAEELDRKLSEILEEGPTA